MQVLRVCRFSTFALPPALPPCCCPLAFQHQVRRLASRISSESYPGYPECVVSCHGADRVLQQYLIVFLGRTFSGHYHDYSMLKQELPPDLDWFADLRVRVDLGYLGIQSDYRGDQMEVPHKKPRRSKKHTPSDLVVDHWTSDVENSSPRD